MLFLPFAEKMGLIFSLEVLLRSSLHPAAGGPSQLGGLPCRRQGPTRRACAAPPRARRPGALAVESSGGPWGPGGALERGRWGGTGADGGRRERSAAAETPAPRPFSGRSSPGQHSTTAPKEGRAALFFGLPVIRSVVCISGVQTAAECVRECWLLAQMASAAPPAEAASAAASAASRSSLAFAACLLNFAARLAACFAAWLTRRLGDWLNERLADWLTERRAPWLTGCLAD